MHSSPFFYPPQRKESPKAPNGILPRHSLAGTTKLIIAQRITSVADADRIVVLENGRIDGVGTHEELLKTNEIYRDVYTSQQKGVE